MTWETGEDNVNDRIVLSRGIAGNSFWVLQTEEKCWILGLWGPAYYLIPEEVDVLDVCLCLLRSTKKTLPDVNDAFKRKFQLRRISEDELGCMRDVS